MRAARVADGKGASPVHGESLPTGVYDRMLRRGAGALAILLVSGGSALASPGIAIPEPSDPWLFGLGLVGLVVGRQVARKRKPD